MSSRATMPNLGLKGYSRFLRLPFIMASALPFTFGSLISRNSFKFMPFLWGLASVVFTHLGANLLNDYADSKSGADWQDKKFYKFFGGSKLIQEGTLGESFYLKFSVICFIAAFLCVTAVSILIQNVFILCYYFLIIFFGFSYSHKPLQFSYHRFGELIIFLLFGPALVCGANFIQTEILLDFKSFLLSLPCGFFTTAILFSNEVPDLAEDIKVKKFTWVSLVGPERAFIIYSALSLLGFFYIGVAITLRFLSLFSLFSFICIIPVLKSAVILKKYPLDKSKLIRSSKLTIMAQALVNVVLIIDYLL